MKSYWTNCLKDLKKPYGIFSQKDKESNIGGLNRMNSYPMRTISKCGKYLVDFTLQDGPCPVSGEHFVLTERPGSPILCYNDVVRGSDIPHLYEHDIIEDEHGEEFIVFYSRGMLCKSLETNRVQNIPRKFKNSSNIYKRGIDIKIKSQHKFKYGNNLFTLQEIFGVMNGKLLVNADSLVIDPSLVQEYSGLRTTNKEMIFFGDQGIYLKDGRAVVERDGEILDVVKREYVF